MALGRHQGAGVGDRARQAKPDPLPPIARRKSRGAIGCRFFWGDRWAGTSASTGFWSESGEADTRIRRRDRRRCGARPGRDLQQPGRYRHRVIAAEHRPSRAAGGRYSPRPAADPRRAIWCGARASTANCRANGGVPARGLPAARTYEARTAEINPLALTERGELIALDARFTIDDYAVYRHPDLGIEIAREFDRPPTELEKIAWNVEKHDYRGTFYFIQMQTDFRKGERVIGFHGAGGGGSMMNHGMRCSPTTSRSPTLSIPAATRPPAKSTARRASSQPARH
ncbi:MAG: hypothetical protein IPK17_20680 [Chloroflexi bacterium]|uniref:hypothetical protein n=1 Tax=Candidatus Flexifilum breve TaxID=3140694 RepID=UPI0031351552|nr:hypothetical protein [Chloroflexota bacterium]